MPEPEAAIHPRPLASWGRAARVGVFVMLAIASFEIGTRSLAGYQTTRAMQALESWQAAGSQLAVSSWEQSVRGLALAQRLDSNNPTLLQVQAEVYRSRTFPGIWREPLDPAERQEILSRAAEAAQQSAMLRPRWAPTHSLLAMLKAELGEFDQAYEDSLRRAVRYGPWDGNVAWQVTRAALAGWRTLEPETRSTVLDHVMRGLTSRSTGVPGQVERLFFRQVAQLGPDDILMLQERLVTTEWPADRIVELTAFTVQLWPIWRSPGKGQLREKIVGIYRSGVPGLKRGMLWEIANAGELLYFCPSLPADEPRRLYCRQVQM